MIESDTKVFGFWLYLMTDLILFSVLFAAFVVLHNNTFGAPDARSMFELPEALLETLVLLTSSFTCALAWLATMQRKKKASIAWFTVTFFLGAFFLSIELFEFTHLIHKEITWQKSAFLSSYFTLVGTHGLHILIGLLWMLVTIFQLALRPLLERTAHKIFRIVLFWHFLDLVWIFIFAVVYGMGILI